MKRLHGTSRRLITLLAATILGAVGVVVVASPASAHNAGVQPSTYCEGTQSKVKFKITSQYHHDSDHVKITSVSGTFTAAQLGIDTTNYYPVASTDAVTTVLVTNAVNIGNGVPFTITVTLAWFDQQGTTYVSRKGLNPTASGAGTSADCHVPEAPKANFVDTCDSITATFSSETPKTFKLTGAGGFEVTSPSGQTAWAPAAVPADKAPLTAFADGQPIGSPHQYTKPQFCGAPTGTTESKCDGLFVSLTNPADGKEETASITFTPNTGSPVTLSAARGETKTHTFPGSPGLTVTFTPIGAGSPTTLAWTPDQAKCTPTTPPATTAPPDLAVTGSNLGGVIAAGSALIAGGIGLLVWVFFLRRRRTIENT